MSCFKVPQGVFDSIRAAITRFCWGQKNDKKRTHWIRWENLCKLKWEGGIGLRDLGSFNKALLVKQGWHLIQNESILLAQTLKIRYFPRGEFQHTEAGYNPIYTWTSNMEGRSVLELGLICVMGCDPWVMQMRAFEFCLIGFSNQKT